MGDALTAAQYREAEELGILVDKDDQARPALPETLFKAAWPIGAPCAPECEPAAQLARLSRAGVPCQAWLLPEAVKHGLT